MRGCVAMAIGSRGSGGLSGQIEDNARKGLDLPDIRTDQRIGGAAHHVAEEEGADADDDAREEDQQAAADSATDEPGSGLRSHASISPGAAPAQHVPEPEAGPATATARTG